jgi:hypothetical protein
VNDEALQHDRVPPQLLNLSRIEEDWLMDKGSGKFLAEPVTTYIISQVILEKGWGLLRSFRRGELRGARYDYNLSYV